MNDEQLAPESQPGPEKGEIMRPGTLYLVGTPIGHLGDLSPRAASMLASADWVVAEDTRRTLRLLNYLGLRKHLESYHEHNRLAKEPVLVQQLLRGCRMALVTDAGMPGISDPGSGLVAACVAEGIPVVVIPGPCAAITALAGSGLTTDRFVFEGFLPGTGKARKIRLAELASETRTLVLYEAPHRLQRTLDDLAAQGLADRLLTLARELTKHHEEYVRITVGQAAARCREVEPRGEFVLVLEGLEAYRRRLPPPEPSSAGGSADPAIPVLLELLRAGVPLKTAARQCAAVTGRSRNELYALALRLQDQSAGRPESGHQEDLPGKVGDRPVS